ncbi:MAG TPA: hypothetical protein VFW07_18285 [Parafilimonas sp.]|nr:hypothetical protein [Parafilimonas sp.]
MSLQQSYLSQAAYGYDTVVAVSQSALNDAIKYYYINAASRFQEVTFYFATDADSGLPTLIDIDSLKLRTNGVDPLTVPAWNGAGAMPANVSSVVNGKFNFAFKFTPGNPPRLSTLSYIQLNPSQQTAIYYLLCQDTWPNAIVQAIGGTTFDASGWLSPFFAYNYNLPPSEARTTALAGLCFGIVACNAIWGDSCLITTFDQLPVPS